MARWPARFVDSIAEQLSSKPFSEGGIVVQVTDDLAAQRPQIVHVLTNGLGREAGGGQMLNERPETEDQRFPWRQIFLNPIQ